MQIKRTMSFHLAPERMAILKNSKTNKNKNKSKVKQNIEMLLRLQGKEGHFLLVGGKVN